MKTLTYVRTSGGLHFGRLPMTDNEIRQTLIRGHPEQAVKDRLTATILALRIPPHQRWTGVADPGARVGVRKRPPATATSPARRAPPPREARPGSPRAWGADPRRPPPGRSVRLRGTGQASGRCRA